MKYVFLALSWIFGLFFIFLLVLSLMTKNWLASLCALIAALMLIPPVRHWISDAMGIPLPLWLRFILIPVLFLLFNFFIFKTMGNRDSIYKTPEIQSKLMAIYDAKISQWPVPYQTRFIDTEYGKVHVIISGPEDAPPVMLFHASAMGGWSWLYNIEGMNQHFRTFAVDWIGDAGRSELNDTKYFPKNGPEITMLVSTIMDSLGVEKAPFIGGSQGGYISTQVALNAPERVTHLILCGPMGYTGTNLSVLRIILTTMFPVKPLQDSSTRWAFGDDTKVLNAVGDWFKLILQGVISQQARPRPFTPEEFQQIKAPMLLMLGTNDGLVGNPENTKKVVADIPGVQVEVLETGHLISAEMPERFNELVINFIQKNAK